eukprot:tig00000388_g24827.t1
MPGRGAGGGGRLVPLCILTHPALLGWHRPVKHPSGLSFEDVKPGTGKKPQPGKKVTVHYTGRLPNGKIFDSSLGKSPFSFRLGIGEVIKGWDIGVSSMQVGGKRKLVIPANLAYGPRGAPPDIPPNATLHFDVELLDAK